MKIAGLAAGIVASICLCVSAEAGAITPSPARFVSLSAETQQRYGPVAVDSDGKVFIAGGATNVGFGAGAAIKLVEYFNPAGTGGGTIESLPSPAPQLKVTRYFPAAAALSDGRVLIVGGFGEGGGTFRTAEVFDPTTNTITETKNPPAKARSVAFAVTLADGDVLIGGGDSSTGEALRETEIYDPTTETFTELPALDWLEKAREGAAAVALEDGRVVVFGGQNINAKEEFASFEIRDPASGIFAQQPRSMVSPRVGAVAAPLPNGQVLIAGGERKGAKVEVLRIAETFDPKHGEFTSVPETGSGEMITARGFAAAAALPDGRVVILDGTHDTTDALKSVEVFEAAPEAQVGTENFGQQPLNATVPHTVTVTNTGVQPLIVEGFSLGGPDPGDFSIGASECNLGKAVPAKGTCSFTVNFDPQALGERVATIRLNDNEPVPLTMIVSGTGATPTPPTSISTGPGQGTTTKGSGTGGKGGGKAPQFDLLKCTLVKASSRPRSAKHLRCAVSTQKGTFLVTGKSIKATLERSGHVVARGKAASASATRLQLTPKVTLTKGHYTLVLSIPGKHGRRHSVTTPLFIS